ncbi:MAG: S8 family serine peptidase, partial [Planctomycetes bacterium]|nr:S8 family serine peptidase [Planctomycetota bacterium]
MIPTDPLFGLQWHLRNTGQTGGTAGVDINVVDVWDEFTGQGVDVGIIDDGFDIFHQDLDGNYDTTRDLDLRDGDDDARAVDPGPSPAGDNHGTQVAGLIGAEQGNDFGGVGVAYDATLVGYRIGFDDEFKFGDLVSALQQQVNVDVSNNSYGFGGFFTDDFAGRIANKQIQLAPALNDSVHQVTSEVWYATIFLFGAAAILAETDARLLIPLGLWFAGFLAIAWWFIPRITRLGRDVAAARSTLAGRIVDSYSNIQTVKLFAHAEREEEYARHALEDFRWTFARQLRLFTLLTMALTVLSTLLIGGVIGYAIWLWSLGAITVGAIAAASALILRLNGMVDWIMWTLTTLFQNIGTVQEGMETVSQTLRLKDRP